MAPSSLLALGQNRLGQGGPKQRHQGLVNQLPIFVTLSGRKVILVGEGEAADAKRRLIERAGGVCVGADDTAARLAFVACENFEEIAARLKARGLLVNVVDEPAHCDFTTPAIIDRDPVLVAIGTGGASAGLAKALRQRLETMLPQNLGALAKQFQNARNAIRSKWPDNSLRRKAIDDALSEAGMLDPLADGSVVAFGDWLEAETASPKAGLAYIMLRSTDPDDLTLREARLLGQADHIFAAPNVPDSILNRSRADAERHVGEPPAPVPPGLVLHVRLQNSGEAGTGAA